MSFCVCLFVFSHVNTRYEQEILARIERIFHRAIYSNVESRTTTEASEEREKEEEKEGEKEGESSDSKRTLVGKVVRIDALSCLVRFHFFFCLGSFCFLDTVVVLFVCRVYILIW